jgi:hypothetical protein
MNDIQISMRLPSDLVERAEAMATVLAKVPEFKLWRMSRQAVIRLALSKGLDALEAQHRAPSRRTKR